MIEEKVTMNILYITKSYAFPWAGPTYSMPNQIFHQAKFDNVYWLNCVSSAKDKNNYLLDSKWKDYSFYSDFDEVKTFELKRLPQPFNRPDLVVIEQFYPHFFPFFIIQLIKCNIPYIIIPRGELTKGAQNHKWLKKKICNFLYYRFVAKHAAAIQYLTTNELQDSGAKWNNQSLVIPNGITDSSIKKTDFSDNGIRCVTVGRLDMDHKGYDLLVEACASIKTVLEKNNVSIDIYGHGTDSQKEEIEKIIKENNVGDIITVNPPVFGLDKTNILLSSDVYCLTSRFEGHPMALIEAMNLGLPCLVTTGSNMKDEVNVFNAGWTANCSVEDIRKALLKMIDDKDLLCKIGNNAITLSKQYEWQILAEESHVKYQAIINN